MEPVSLSSTLKQLAGEGRFQSSGHFTLGWERAVSKLKEYQVGDPDAYLLFLVSAARAYGAKRVSVKENARRLEVIMHEAYIPESEILIGFNSILLGKAGCDTLDLAMGLHGVAHSRFDSVELTATASGHPSYCWRLTDLTEESLSCSEQSRHPMVRVVYEVELPKGNPLSLWRRIFPERPPPGSLGGYAGMSPSCRLVDQRCCLSDIPITVNNNLVNRPIHLPRAPVAAKVGKVLGVKFHSPILLECSREDWTGAVALTDGPLHFVINGVAYPPEVELPLCGAVWVRLNRDMSRQRIVQDREYKKLLKALEDLSKEMEQMIKDPEEH